MSVYIDREKCKGCALCVSVCPVQAISMVDDKAFIDRKSCTTCLICVDECPTNAIRQTFEKDIYFAKSEKPLPGSPGQIIPAARESSSITKWSQNAVKKEPMDIHRLIRAVDRFFTFEPPAGMGRRGKKGRRRRQRGRYRV
jgi:Pyruvate/2-oxoacid:ferredoxin oxidoreductase delta subunit